MPAPVHPKHLRPCTEYSPIAARSAVAIEALEAGDVVAARGLDASGRLRVVKAGATNEASGGNAVLYVAMTDAEAEGLVTISRDAIITGVDLSGAGAHDQVFLSDTVGTVSLTAGTVSRQVGTALSTSSYIFCPTN